jgi:hypothetical protein
MRISESALGKTFGSPPGKPDRRTPEAFRILDWTRFDSPPSAIDIKRMLTLAAQETGARFAVVINTPKMLGAATIFAEQAGLQGAQVRVFVDAKEAVAWLYKDVSPEAMGLA